MKKEEFVYGILTFFGKQENQALLGQYNKALETYKKVDWNKLYSRCISQIQDRKLPMPAWFINQFDKCLETKRDIIEQNNGMIFYVELTNGLKYEHEIYNCPLSLSEIKNKLQKKFSYQDEQGEHTKVKNILIFNDYYEYQNYMHRRSENVG